MESHKKLRIALYHPWIHTKGGAERVLLEYAKRSKHSVTLFTHHYNKENTFPELSQFPIIVLSDAPIKRMFHRALLGMKIFFQKIDLQSYDVFMVSTGGVGELVALRNNAPPTIFYCHTPLRVAHDLYEKTLHTMPSYKRFPFFMAIHSYRMFERLAWKKAAKIIANSFTVKKRIMESRLPAKDITVVSPGVDTDIFRPSSVTKKYIFVPGRLKRYKRLELAIESFKEFKKKFPEYKLIIAGSVDDKKYLDELKTMLPKDAEIILSPSEEKLVKLYAECACLLFTAQDEDWGLVPLEAMASGKPVISVNEGGPTEYIRSGENGFLVNPNAHEISKTLENLMRNMTMYKRISQEAVETASKYSWTEFTKRIDLIVEKTVL